MGTMAATEYTDLAAAAAIAEVDSNVPEGHTQAPTKAFHIGASLDTTAAPGAAATLVIASMPLVAVSILMAPAGAAAGNLATNVLAITDIGRSS